MSSTVRVLRKLQAKWMKMFAKVFLVFRLKPPQSSHKNPFIRSTKCNPRNLEIPATTQAKTRHKLNPSQASKPLEKFPHVLHTATAPTTATRLRRTQIFPSHIYSGSLATCREIVSKAAHKKIHEFKFKSHEFIFGAPCFSYEVAKRRKKYLRRRNAHFFSSSLAFTAAADAAAWLLCNCRFTGANNKKTQPKSSRIMSRNSHNPIGMCCRFG